LNVNSLFVVSFMSETPVHCDKTTEAIKVAQGLTVALVFRVKFDDKIIKGSLQQNFVVE